MDAVNRKRAALAALRCAGLLAVIVLRIILALVIICIFLVIILITVFQIVLIVLRIVLCIIFFVVIILCHDSFLLVYGYKHSMAKFCLFYAVQNLIFAFSFLCKFGSYFFKIGLFR